MTERCHPVDDCSAEKMTSAPDTVKEAALLVVTEGQPNIQNVSEEEYTAMERRIRLKVDMRLCTIAGILCSLNLLDSGILSSASVTSMFEDLDLRGSRYSVSIFIFTIASVVAQLPCTVAVRVVGPRVWFALITFCFGLITLCTAFIQNWKQMIALRVLLGFAMSGIYPGLTYLISTWYTRTEQQLRFAFLQSGEVLALATGTIVNYALNRLDGKAGLRGWRWMFPCPRAHHLCPWHYHLLVDGRFSGAVAQKLLLPVEDGGQGGSAAYPDGS